MDDDNVIDVTNPHRQDGVLEYSRGDAEGLVGRMVKSQAEAGVYGKVVDVQGYQETGRVEQPHYGVLVDWNQKPKAEISRQSVLFKSDIDKHYPLVYGNELAQAQHVWNVADKAREIKSDMAQPKAERKGRGV